MRKKLFVAFVGLMLFFCISVPGAQASGWIEGRLSTEGYILLASGPSFSVEVPSGKVITISNDCDPKWKKGCILELGHLFVINGQGDVVPWDQTECPKDPKNGVVRSRSFSFEGGTISFDNREDSGTGEVWWKAPEEPAPSETPTPSVTPIPSETPVPSVTPIPTETSMPPTTTPLVPTEAPLPSITPPMPHIEGPGFCEIMDSTDFPESVWSDFGGSSLKRLSNGNYEISILPVGFEGDFWLYGPEGWKKLIHKVGQICNWGEVISTPTPTPITQAESRQVTFIDTSVGSVVPDDQLDITGQVIVNGKSFDVVRVWPNSRGVIVVPGGKVGLYLNTLLIHNSDAPEIAEGQVSIEYQGFTYRAKGAQSNGIFNPPSDVGERFQIGTCSANYQNNIFYDLVPVG